MNFKRYAKNILACNHSLKTNQSHLSWKITLLENKVLKMAVQTGEEESTADCILLAPFSA